MKATIGLVGFWIAAAALASRIPVEDIGPAGSAADTSAVSKLFGSSREVISKQLYVEADRYFHRGVSGTSDRAFADHLFLKWGDAISPRAHVELEGDSIAEIMPWLRMATKADPSNIEAYSTAAYWLYAQGDIEAAYEVLLEAQKLNPGDYRASLSLGRMYHRNGDKRLALEQFELARGQWPSNQAVDDRQVQIDLSAILSFRAALYEQLGQTDWAIQGYREIVGIFPHQDAIVRRLHDLEHGHELTESSTDFWDGEFAKLEQARGGRHIAGGGHVHHEGCSHAPEPEPEPEEHVHGPECMHGGHVPEPEPDEHVHGPECTHGH